MKDSVIHRLQNELKNAEYRFIKDQEKQTADIDLLVSRINEQINVMRKVVRAQLILIEVTNFIALFYCIVCFAFISSPGKVT